MLGYKKSGRNITKKIFLPPRKKQTSLTARTHSQNSYSEPQQPQQASQ